MYKKTLVFVLFFSLYACPLTGSLPHTTPVQREPGVQDLISDSTCIVDETMGKIICGGR